MPISPEAEAETTSARDAAVFEALLGDADAQLVYEGLYRLRELKVEALRAIRAEGVHAGSRPFEPRDFGIPQIDCLLKRLGADPAEEASPLPEC